MKGHLDLLCLKYLNMIDYLNLIFDSIGKVMLEIMAQLTVLMIDVINITNKYSLKEKLQKFLDVSGFYNLSSLV